jgi:hypothetical protein
VFSGEIFRISARAGNPPSFNSENDADLNPTSFADGEILAVECKSRGNVGSNDLEGFRSLGSYINKPHRKIIIYGGATPRRIDDVEILPFQLGLREIFMWAR